MGWGAMEIVYVLIALLARHRFSTCAAPEFSLVLEVSALCAEGGNKNGASQRLVVMLLGGGGL